MKSSQCCIAAAASLFFLSCATTGEPVVDRSNSLRVVGRESDVRIDAQFASQRLGAGARIRVTYEIANHRATPIAIVDVAEASYDHSSRTITMNVGSEIPDAAAAPKVVLIPAGQKRRFSSGASCSFPAVAVRRLAGSPDFIRLRVNFLGGTDVVDALLAGSKPPVDDLFTAWLEDQEVVLTNSVPIEWAGNMNAAHAPAERGGAF